MPIRVRRTRDLTRYGGILALTGTNGVGGYVVRKVTYPKNYVKNTKAGTNFTGASGTLGGCMSDSRPGLPSRRLRGLRLGWLPRGVPLCGSPGVSV